MSEILAALRQAVGDEQRRGSGFQLAHVEAATDDGSTLTINLQSQADDVPGVRAIGDSSASVGDTGLVLTLGENAAPTYWRRAPFRGPQADPPVVSV